MKAMLNAVCFRRLAVFCILLAVCGSGLWAGGRKDKIQTVTAEGGEIWENDFDVSEHKKGLYNYIVYARDRAGNEAISGPFNVKVNPNAGLPIARVVYPENNGVVRQNINVLGVASGRYGVSRVLTHLDDSEYADVTGLDYWNQFIDFSNIADGKHTLFIQVIDAKGVAGPEQRLNFTLDRTPPVIELVSHKIGDIITGTTTIRGEASDPNGIRLIAYSEDGVKFSPLPGRKRGDTLQEFSLAINTRKSPDGPLVCYLQVVDTTGVATVKPYLFFVTNNGPELDVYSPAVNEDVYGRFLLSGRAYDKIGLSALYYEWGKISESIQMHHGDPFWCVPLEMDKTSATSIRVVAVDKVGNITSITRKLEDRRKVKVPVLVIDFPSEDVLKSMQKGIPADTAIYGHIAPGVDPYSVLVEGFGEVEALSSFRIPPNLLPSDKKVQTLKLTPVDIDSIRGAPLSLRYLKQDSLMRGESQVDVILPEKNSWLSGYSFTLQGSVPNMSEGQQLEYRLNPDGSWQPISLDAEGVFSAEISMSERAQGPVHLELKTVQYGQENYPMYHPFIWAASEPEIQILSPAGDYSVVFGSKTVIGTIDHAVPIRSVAYSHNNENFADIDFITRYGKAWFSYFCDFSSLSYAGDQLTFRVTDASGALYAVVPEYTIDPEPPVPVIIVNTPVDEETITSTFDISGLAYYDVPISGVYWRLLGPRMESISPGAAGEFARREAAVYEANPDRPFQEMLTDQTFRIPVDFSVITDGEYVLEIYAEDIYGTCSETVSRIIKVSTAPPDTEVRWPIITHYNQKAIIIKGFSSDANDIADVSISMDNGNTYQHVELAPNGDWELALNTAVYTDGIYSALVRTEDKYGVLNYSNAMINIDNTPPEVYLTSPVNGQHVGTDMPIMGRVSDNVMLRSLTYQVISAANPTYRRTIEVNPTLVLFDTISLSGFPQGDYILRIVAQDLAENETLVSRKFVYDADDEAAEINIYNPLPGEIHSGPVHIVGIVTGSFQPREVRLSVNGSLMSLVPVERYGIFRFEIPEALLDDGESYRISAAYDSETGNEIASPEHTLYYSRYGPILQIESHQDSDVITARPWLSGRAWISIPEPGVDDPPLTYGQKAEQKKALKVRDVTVSYDNGRTFRSTRGSQEWKVRMETSELPRGPQPVVVRAVFANGDEAVRRLMLIVDTTLPQVETLTPPEDSVHRDNIQIYGTAGDNLELANVDISLRPGDKFFYSIPPAMRGMYFDIKGFGATYFDVGLGLSLFNDNVRLQAQFGLAPPDGQMVPVGKRGQRIVEGGRYVGYVYGVKLLANIFYLPFAYLFGLDWAFYSMNFAVGANFSWFSMDTERSALFIGAIVGQWDIANVNMQFFYPEWKRFRNYALYVEPELWFASSDVQADVLFRMTIGVRINWF